MIGLNLLLLEYCKEVIIKRIFFRIFHNFLEVLFWSSDRTKDREYGK